MAILAFMMTYSIRYYRGLLIIAEESEYAAYRARLEASGCVVLDNLIGPSVAATNQRSARRE